MPEALFLELLTTHERERMACFRKFPGVDNPVDLIDNVGALFLYEAENNSPCTPLHERCYKINFAFNAKLNAGDFVIKPECQKVLEAWESELAHEIERFKGSSAVIHHWFPELASFQPGQSEVCIHEAMREVAENAEKVRGLYGQIRRRYFPIHPQGPELGVSSLDAGSFSVDH